MEELKSHKSDYKDENITLVDKDRRDEILEDIREEFLLVTQAIRDDYERTKFTYKGDDGKEYYNHEDLDYANKIYDESINPKKNKH